MRIETKRLLDRLGQPDFQYREYDETPSSGVERWPLFELVSRQLRVNRPVAGQDDHEPEAAEAADHANSVQALVGRIAKGRGH